MAISTLPLVDAPLLPVTELGGGNMRFLASTANGIDRLTLMYGNQGVAYSGKSIVDPVHAIQLSS